MMGETGDQLTKEKMCPAEGKICFLIEAD